MPDCRNCHKLDTRAELCAAVSDDISPLRACLKTLLERECSQVEGNVLEIGCGSWDFSKRLLEEKGCKWFSVDPVLVDRKGRQSIATYQGKVAAVVVDMLT